MTIDRDQFWAKASSIFNGPSQSQVDGTNAILDYWDSDYLPPMTGGREADIRWLAYALATALWETNRTMQPVREAYYLNPPGPHQNDASGPAEEYRKKLRYYPYYGRGLVQLTWEANYKAAGGMVGQDLVNHPDYAMSKDVAPAIMLKGMEHGMFGGVGFAHWFDDTTDDPVGARHLVNGTDHAEDISNIYSRFIQALT